MDMTFKNVLDIQGVDGAILHDGLAVRVGCSAGGGVIIEDGVKDDGLFRGWVGDDVGHGRGRLVEKAVYLRLGREGHVSIGNFTRSHAEYFRWIEGIV